MQVRQRHHQWHRLRLLDRLHQQRSISTLSSPFFGVFFLPPWVWDLAASKYEDKEVSTRGAATAGIDLGRSRGSMEGEQ